MTTRELDLERGPVIEELTVVPASVASSGVGRAMLVVAALIAGVGVAVAVPSWLPETDTIVRAQVGSATIARPLEGVATAPAVVVESPRTGAVTSEPTILVSAVADRPLASSRIALLVGDAVIGWAGVRDVPAGRFEARVEAFLPAVRLPAELSVSGVDTLGSFEVRQAVTLAAVSPILVWSAASSVDGRTVVVEGTAPLTTDRVDVRIVGADGHTLGSATAAVVVDSWRPGAEGGRLLGVGSFRSTIEVGPAGRGHAMSAVVVAAGDASIGAVTRAVSSLR